MLTKIISTEGEYQKALARLDEIFDAKKETPAGDELELLSLLIEDYENRIAAIAPPDPIEALRFRMDQMNYSATDLAEVIGSQQAVSDVMNKRRKLTLSMIRRIHESMEISLEVLIKDYRLTRRKINA